MIGKCKTCGFQAGAINLSEGECEFCARNNSDNPEKTINKLLFSKEGRVNRQTYWILMAVFILGTLITSYIDISNTGSQGATYFIFIMIIFIPSLVIQVKRWHDRDKSGFWMLISIIPIIGAIWALVENGFLAGTDGNNRFGANPLL